MDEQLEQLIENKYFEKKQQLQEVNEKRAGRKSFLEAIQAYDNI